MSVKDNLLQADPATYVEPKTNFTKATMSIVYFLYIIGALLGAILVVCAAIRDVNLGLQIDTGMFIAYAAYLGTPTAVAIGFYAWKSKAENLLKIKNSNKDKESDPLIDTLANMRGDS